MSGFKSSGFEFDSDKPPQATVIEEQVQRKVAPIDGDSFLPRDKGEPFAEFQQKAF